MTIDLDELLAHEVSDRPVEAVKLYERAISDGTATVTDCLNLAVICVASQDPGYAAKHALSREFCSNAFEQVVEIAALLGETNAEAEFWRDYLNYVAIGDSPKEERWLRTLIDGESDVPAIYFGRDSESIVIEESKRRLREEVHEGKTIRARYIQSFLTSDDVR